MERNVRIQYGKMLRFSALTSRLTDQRNLGMSMRVERASLDNVKERLAALKRKKEQPKEDYGECIG
jgi:hypothetical protein